jgi:hypothetical protein
MVNSLALRLVIFLPLGAISFSADRLPTAFFVKLFFMAMIISLGGSKCCQGGLTPGWWHQLPF